MGVIAILVMWPRCREQTIVPPTHRDSTQILTLIGQSVSEEKMFEECERATSDAEAWVYYKLTWWACGQGELKT